MDVALPEQKINTKRLALIGGIAVVVVVLLSGYFLQPQGQHKIQRSKLLLADVQRGQLTVTIDGYGVLRSNKQTLITAQTSATVQEVVLRPGAQVEKDSIILRLSNPAFLQEVEAASMAVRQEQSNFKRLILSNRRALLAEQTTLARLDADLQEIQLRREAQQKLLADAVVSQLDYKTTVLRDTQMQKSMMFQQQRIEQLKEESQIALDIQQEQINLSKTRYQSLALRAEQLTVRAGFSGILQRLPVELGQSVIAGQELALVGSDKDLLALIRVSQARAEQLKVGQRATINTRREKVPGVLTRITPEVVEGTIEVEIAFSEGVPSSARPELNVDAQVIVSNLDNTLYIERPLNAQSHSDSALFKIQDDNTMAQLQNVRFGEEAGRYIQIIGGANEQDRFILSDMTRFRDAKSLRIID